ncbi:Deoxyribonuclease TatD [Minicystis rosea]|nr:Deoxyribonuclease TatD [Minicystis rosea]
MKGLVDIGANLTNKAFRDDLGPVLGRAASAGVGAIIITGTSAAASRRAWEIAVDREHRRSPSPRLFATAGVHPHEARSATRDTYRELRELLARPEVVAVGECGLDYNRDFSPRDRQRASFEAQLALAVEVRKPVFLHERDAHDDFARVLASFRPELAGGVVHCFTGERRALERYLEMDLHIGITGWICDERRGTHLRSLVRAIPKDRLLVETDAPYLLPRDLANKPERGRNEPALVGHVARAVAAARGESIEEITAATTATAERLFGLGQ